MRKLVSTQTTTKRTDHDQGRKPVSYGKIERPKNPAAVALGRLGGVKGGKARAEKLSAAERTAIARKAAESRWRRPDEQ